MTTPSPQRQRDNLNIGLFLAQRPYGAELEQILQGALGYSPQGPPPTNNRAHYETRFRTAESVGRDAFRERRPGYFTFNAQPFGHIYVYKVTWYVWLNPQTSTPQTVPIPSADLREMRTYHDKYMDTRTGTTRNIRTAYDIEDRDNAIARGDSQDARLIEQRMVDNDSWGRFSPACTVYRSLTLRKCYLS